MAKDMDESIAFYTEMLGFRFLRRATFGPPESRRELAYVGLGDFLLELLELPQGAAEVPPGAGRPFALTVSNMEQTVADLRSKGVEVDMDIRPGFSFDGLATAIKDPSGLVIELREWQGSDNPYYADWQPTRSDVVRTA